MSNPIFARPTVSLLNFSKFIYNEATDLISELYAGSNGFWFQKLPLEKIGQNLAADFELVASSDFIKEETVKENNSRLTVDDGPLDRAGASHYTYRAGMFFTINGQKLAVLLPKMDKAPQRSVVAFTENDQPDERIDQFLHQLAEQIKIQTPDIIKFRNSLRPRRE